jgi:hypothetical protein
MRFRVYIDEAGDQGLGATSSVHFLVAAVIVRESKIASALSELSALGTALARGTEHPIHFRNLSHSQKIKAAADAAMLPIDAISMAIMCKRHFLDPPYIGQTDPMYLFAVRLVLERTSWYLRDQGATEALVTFAHVRRFRVSKLHDYRRALETTPTEIHWTPFEGHPFQVSAPTEVRLLQVADIAASAAFKAIEPDSYGNTEPRYLDNLGPKLYRYRPSSAITNYGLRVYPTHQGQRGGSLFWLRSRY